MAVPTGIQGQTLEITVVGCNKLRDTEWISRQDPYVCLEYASSKFRTRTCTDGGKNPTFNEKFVFTLIEGLREINVNVWNSNTLSNDDFIGSGKIQLHKVLSQGFDDTAWPLSRRSGRYGGEVKLIMYYAGAQKQGKPAASAAPPPYPAGAYMPPPPYPTTSYPPTSSPYPPPHGQPSIPGYPPSSYPPASSHYPPPATTYPPAPTAPPQASAYPPPPYPPPPTYPPQIYPPSQPPHPYPPAYPGVYPPPPRY